MVVAFSVYVVEKLHFVHLGQNFLSLSIMNVSFIFDPHRVCMFVHTVLNPFWQQQLLPHKEMHCLVILSCHTNLITNLDILICNQTAAMVMQWLAFFLTAKRFLV